MPYYVVHKGHKVGIYSKWDDCNKQIYRAKGAVYKKLTCKKEAELFLKHGRNYMLYMNSDKPKTDDKDRIAIYTDGSFMKRAIPLCGYGVYIPSKNIRISRKFTNGKLTNNRAELTAIITTMRMFVPSQKINIYTDSSYSILICTGTGKKYEKQNYKDVTNADLIKQAVELLKVHKDVKFTHVKAHTGKKDNHSINNDIADRLAVGGALS